MKTPSYIKKAAISKLIRLALKEDIGSGDVTSRLTIDPDLTWAGAFILKEDGIIAGLEVLQEVYAQLDGSVKISLMAGDGDYHKSGKTIAKIKGKARSILAGERTALNFLQRMSGIATLTNKFVNEVNNTKATILDTRKTAPGLRVIDKWAVIIGGGSNHRIGLFDCILVKENHIIASGGIKNTLDKIKKHNKKLLPVVFEVRNLSELKAVMHYGGCSRIMLDNMSLQDIREAAEIANGKIPLEVSGNVNLKNVRKIAEAGIDFISVGMLTHSVKALDISLILNNNS